MWLRDNLIAHKNFLYREEKRIRAQLKQLPEGKLITKKSHGREYYYAEKDGVRISLFARPDLRNQYRFKAKLEKQLARIMKNLPFLEKLLLQYEPLLALQSGWDSIEAQQNTYFAENQKHVYQGVYYRSKSEMLIAIVLTSFGIEFKYESKLYVNGRYLYPDFIIKRPKDGKVFIWEHFGKMTDDDYRKKNFRRLEDYHLEGFDLWDNLIASFDQGDGSLNMDYIEKIIQLYLL